MESDSQIADTKAVQDVKEGRKDRIVELMDRYGNQLMNYLFAILKNREDAEDAFQDTWSRVMERIDDFRSGMAFAPWLFRIGRNRAYDCLRYKNRWWSLERHSPDGEVVEFEIAGSVQFADSLERRELIECLLRDLKPIDRDVLWLKFVDDLSHEEIADVWGVPAATVRTRLRRALRRVTERYSELEGLS